MSSLDALRARFARNEGLPFADILTEASIQEVLNAYDVTFRDRVFGPATTIWGFLSQVLSEDHSCRDTVSRIIAHRVASGMAVCSPNTASREDLRRYQLYLVDQGTSPVSLNAAIAGLNFFFDVPEAHRVMRLFFT